MAAVVMLYGQSGTGKSTSLRNFKKGDASVINVSKKPMPFMCDLPVANTGDYKQICELLVKTQSNSIIIDDATYLIVNEYMSKADERGFDKYTNMAKNFWLLMNFCIEKLPENKIVYFIGHSDIADDGREHFKTVGKMLDNTVVPEGYCTVVLKTVVEDGKYYFSTHNNGHDTVKTPFGMFEDDRIDNDLKLVDVKMRQFFKLDKKSEKEGK
ncbi:MAG: ATP-binding protein [Treponema sp.]|nr:ATP-binding protein [Treponema sp.]